MHTFLPVMEMVLLVHEMHSRHFLIPVHSTWFLFNDTDLLDDHTLFDLSLVYFFDAKLYILEFFMLCIFS